MERKGNKGQCDEVHQRHEAVRKVNLDCDNNHRLLKRKVSVFSGFVDSFSTPLWSGREGLLYRANPSEETPIISPLSG